MLFHVCLGISLAPIFEKRSSKEGKKSEVKPKKLSAAELEAIHVRKNFLLSGVPEELKRQQINQSTLPTPREAQLPIISHIQQCVTPQPGVTINPWHLSEVCLPLRHESVSPYTNLMSDPWKLDNFSMPLGHLSSLITTKESHFIPRVCCFFKG